jgi:hypothetical protein
MRFLSQCFAVVLIALAVSPVTAPFAACDLTAVISHEGTVHDESKDLKDLTGDIFAAAAQVPFEVSGCLVTSVRAGLAVVPHIAPPILRL